MGYESDTAARYRAHAEKLRAIADSDGLEQTRQILIRVAMEYETIAKNMDALDAMHKRQRARSDPPMS
jgi:hypothetical protein